MRYLVWQKWSENGTRKELRINLEHGTQAASLQDAVEQFDLLLKAQMPPTATVIDRDTQVLE